MRLPILLAAMFLTLAAAPLVQPAMATAASRPFTVVAVIDSGFSPYHFDFLGSQHPWNLDADATNDVDFTTDPSTYISGHPGATPISLTLPTTAGETVSTRRAGADAAAWSGFASSTFASPNVYWFPDTKVIGALRFGTEFYGDNNAHGTRSAASAAGNWHGACPECVFVLIDYDSAFVNDAMRWATSQPWIDVVTNSYGQGGIVQTSTGGATRDNMYWTAPVNRMKTATEDGQTIVFSAGNGLVNAFDVPMLTYWSSQKGPDWIVTVGAVTPAGEQTYSGSGKPVDISSIGSNYPSAGGTTANGTGTHSGTSNAAPVVAGYFGKVLQKAREALGDTTEGHSGGVVASGSPVSCGAVVPACALGDGSLTRAELQEIVFKNVIQSPTAIVLDTAWPSTSVTYAYQGHGSLTGRQVGTAHYNGEWQKMVDNMLGTGSTYARPAGETSWFVADSFCRQRLWGAWGEGYYTGGTPTFVPNTDLPAIALYDLCSNLPPKPFGSGAP